jgi:hypothetical protein
MTHDFYFCAVLQVLAVPMDPRVPKIRFGTSNKGLLANRRLLLKIDAWPIDSFWPEVCRDG